jgi:Protein of unknown function (DUF1549)/Protein of unknown function (DUF1553)
MTHPATKAGCLLLILVALVQLPSPPRVEAQSGRSDRATPQDVAAELDELCERAWDEAGVRPVRESEDAEFLRRVCLDVEGVVPTETTVAEFLRTRDRERRVRTVRGLLYGPRYARFMAIRWANLLIGREQVLQSGGEESPLVRWLTQQLMANASWDSIVRALLSAEGALDENGATHYLLRYNNQPAEVAGNAMKVFQGLQIQCAQCHDHPYKADWKQTDFWSVAAFFVRAGQRNEEERVFLVERNQGQARLPAPPGQQGALVPPRFYTGQEIAAGPGQHRRRELGRLVTSSDNPYFARATVNRVWSFFFGRGLIDADDVQQTGDLDTVLDALAQEFKASGYDMRRLCEVILSTRAYQLTSRGDEDDKFDQLDVFARAPLRTLAPEQLWFSFDRALDLDGWEQSLRGERQTQFQDRRRQLARDFFRTFVGQGADTLEQNTIPQALALLNGPLTNPSLSVTGEWANPLMQRIVDMRNHDERVSTLFLRIVGRPPDRAELRALRARGLSSTEQAVLLQDLAWALLNSSEFVYNH